MSIESAGHTLLQLKRLLKPRKKSQRQRFIVPTLVSEVMGPFLSSSSCFHYESNQLLLKSNVTF